MSDAHRSIAAILEKHERLQERIRGLESFLELPRPEPETESAQIWAGELSERLGSLRELMVRQFRSEESAGTLQEMALDHPHWADRIKKLVSDHRHLMDRTRSILGSATVYAQGKSPQMLHLRANTRHLLDELAAHEKNEARLYQRLHVRDLGAGASAE